MPFAHDTQVALTAAAVLVNSAEEPDTLTTVAALDEFHREHVYTGRHDRDEAELAAVRAVRPRLRALLTADRDAAVAMVNEVLAEARALPQLVRHDGWDWHLHVVGPEAPLATRITVETAMAVIDSRLLASFIVCAWPATSPRWKILPKVLRTGSSAS